MSQRKHDELQRNVHQDDINHRATWKFSIKLDKSFNFSKSKQGVEGDPG